jgi:surfactin synthase thioesterase subunit
MGDAADLAFSRQRLDEQLQVLIIEPPGKNSQFHTQCRRQADDLAHHPGRSLRPEHGVDNVSLAHIATGQEEVRDGA